jgi:DNA-binding NarL/FixJ family response regulator
MTPVRVLIADDSEAFRLALHEAVEAAPGFEVVAAVDSGEAAIDRTPEARPDFALIDVRMPGLGGFAAAERIAEHHPDVFVVMITADSGGRTIDPARFPVCDKRSLSPSTVAELWRNRSAR